MEDHPLNTFDPRKSGVFLGRGERTGEIRGFPGSLPARVVWSGEAPEGFVGHGWLGVCRVRSMTPKPLRAWEAVRGRSAISPGTGHPGNGQQKEARGESLSGRGNPFTGGRLTLDRMGEPEEGDLSDVAYGLFEILLSRAIREQGRSLFGLVEGGSDFREDFASIFARFATEYPALGEALTARFGSIDAIYRKLTEGEGVIPTKTTLIYWIVQDAPDARSGEMDDEKAGKWLIFLPDDRVDGIWRRVRDTTAAGELGISARVSTAKPNPESRDERKVIYVYTRDWADEADVMRVRERLREMGVIERIGYKRNIETFAGEYSEKGKKVTYYSA